MAEKKDIFGKFTSYKHSILYGIRFD